MTRKRAQLATAVAIAGVLGSAAVAAAATPTLSTRLFAKAGPLAMHATLTVQTAQPTSATAKVGALSSCTVQPVSKPRSGVADKLVCTNASGQKVSVALAPTAATLTYHLAAPSTFNLGSATIQIRHNGDVLYTLTPTDGSVSVPMTHMAALVNGHDVLYVQAGAHTYRSRIVEVH
jgi:hypothetical protein